MHRKDLSVPAMAACFLRMANCSAGLRRAAWISLETKIEDGMLKTQYQFFRQLIHTKEELA